jgi:hypothetical protein
MSEAPDPPTPPPTPVIAESVLTYGSASSFGWSQEGPTVYRLSLPGRPRVRAFSESSMALFYSTGFTFLFGGVVLLIVRGGQLSSESDMFVFLCIVSALVLGQWVFVLYRFIQDARQPDEPAAIYVTATELWATGGLDSAVPELRWRREDVAGVRLDPVNAMGRRAAEARLQVASREGFVVAIRLPWPAEEPFAAHNRRIRELLGFAAEVSNRALDYHG